MGLRLGKSYDVRQICSRRRSCWWFLKFSNTPSTLINVNRNAALQRKRDENCHVLADSLGNALKAVGQPLGTAKRVSQSHWEMPKGHWKPLDISKRGIGKLLGNAQKPTISK